MHSLDVLASQTDARRWGWFVVPCREREILIWMLSLLSLQHTHSCLENKLRRSQEGQQWMAWTPQRESKVHQLCAAQLSFPSLPLALLGPAAQPGARGQRVDFFWTAFSQWDPGLVKGRTKELWRLRVIPAYVRHQNCSLILCNHGNPLRFCLVVVFSEGR